MPSKRKRPVPPSYAMGGWGMGRKKHHEGMMVVHGVTTRGKKPKKRSGPKPPVR